MRKRPPQPIRVLLVDDHRLVREGVRASLENDGRFEVVGECADGAGALPACAKLKPAVVLLDLVLPDVGGFEVARQLRRRQPQTRVVIFTMKEEPGLVQEARIAGASALVSKSASPRNLREAILRAAAGGRSFPRAARAAALTVREREVLALIAAEASSRTIAARLTIAVRTVEKHRENLMRKLGLKGVAALTKHALLLGL